MFMHFGTVLIIVSNFIGYTTTEQSPRRLREFSIGNLDQSTSDMDVGYNIITNYCPSHCDIDGYSYTAVNCITPTPYCCELKNRRFSCCNNESLSIRSNIAEGNNCLTTLIWRTETPLSSLPEGVIKTNLGKHDHIPSNKEGNTNDLTSKDYCPSHCDDHGKIYDAIYCVTPPHCCKMANSRLMCCSNASLAIDAGVTDGFNCQTFPPSEYWQLVLAVCVPLATLSLIAFLAMTSYLMFRKRRARQDHRRQRTGSGSDLSCSSWSMSSISPGNTISLRGCNQNRSLDNSSGDRSYSRRHRSHDRGGVPPMEIFVLGPLIPPPYIDKPPPYSASVVPCSTDGSNNNQYSNVPPPIGDPNGAYHIGDVDSLPDYESVVLDPMVFINTSVVNSMNVDHLQVTPGNSAALSEANENNIHPDHYTDENVMNVIVNDINENILDQISGTDENIVDNYGTETDIQELEISNDARHAGRASFGNENTENMRGSIDCSIQLTFETLSLDSNS